MLTTIVGLIELKGLFPGLMKFAGDGGTPNALVIFGELKSSISSLNIMPVDSERIIAPKLSKLIKLKLEDISFFFFFFWLYKLYTRFQIDIYFLKNRNYYNAT